MNRRKRRTVVIVGALGVVLGWAGCAGLGASSDPGPTMVVVEEGIMEGPATQGNWEEALSHRHVQCGLDDVNHDDIGDALDERVPRRFGERQSDGDRCGDDFETLLFRLQNCEREARGLPPLECDLRLVWAGRAHSRDMIERDYFSHVNPDGEDPGARLEALGMDFRGFGENLALAPTMAHGHTGWMNSRGHRETILKDHFTHGGVGVVRSELGFFMTALFSVDFP